MTSFWTLIYRNSDVAILFCLIGFWQISLLFSAISILARRYDWNKSARLALFLVYCSLTALFIQVSSAPLGQAGWEVAMLHIATRVVPVFLGVLVVLLRIDWVVIMLGFFIHVITFFCFVEPDSLSMFWGSVFFSFRSLSWFSAVIILAVVLKVLKASDKKSVSKSADM